MHARLKTSVQTTELNGGKTSALQIVEPKRQVNNIPTSLPVQDQLVAFWRIDAEFELDSFQHDHKRWRACEHVEVGELTLQITMARWNNFSVWKQVRQMLSSVACMAIIATVVTCNVTRRAICDVSCPITSHWVFRVSVCDWFIIMPIGRVVYRLPIGGGVIRRPLPSSLMFW